ncbi:MAG: DsbA family protein [Chloroflexota bacterium]|nr:DsbA family protein [Chloroflexota bacterium]
MTFSPLPASPDSPPDDNAPRPPSLADQPIATISRVTFNYLLIGTVALVVGLLVGYLGYERVADRAPAPAAAADTEAMIDRAVAAAIAALPTAVVPTEPPPVEVLIADNPTRGAEDAPITMIEFGDFRCGYCKRFNDETIGPLMERFDGKIRLVFRDYPVLGPESLEAALAGECADDQGRFWDFHDMIYATPDQLNRDAFLLYAEALSLDTAAFTTCLDEQTHRAEVIADYAAGQNAGVSGTPTFFINGKILVGAQPLDTFVLAIEAELASLEAAAVEATPEPA